MKKKIVIVEDDYIIQELHKHYVENLGHEVIATFECGKDAIEFFQDNNADLILMDIRLEDSLDGIETMKKININTIVTYCSLAAFLITGIGWVYDNWAKSKEIKELICPLNFPD
jgi:CheY-like chemotaxis protein